MAAKRPKRSSGRSRSSSSSDPSFQGSMSQHLLPVLSVIMGLFLGIGIAYVVKKQFFGDRKPSSDFPIVEELSRERPMKPGRGREPEMVKTWDSRVSGEPVAEIPTELTPNTSQLAESSQPRPLSVDGPKNEINRTPRNIVKPPRPPKSNLTKPTEDRRVSSTRNNTVRNNSSSATVASSPTRSVTPSNNLAMAVVDTPRPPEPKIEEPVSKPVSLSGLTYSRQLFSRCPEDCVLLFRTADGGPIKAKLKKTAFNRVLNSNLSHVDLEGMEMTVDGERMVIVRTMRGHPAKVEMAKPKEEKPADAQKLARTKKEATPADTPSSNLKSRLDSKAKKDKEPPPEEEEAEEEEEEEEEPRAPSSFQDRLKRSVD